MVTWIFGSSCLTSQKTSWSPCADHYQEYRSDLSNRNQILPSDALAVFKTGVSSVAYLCDPSSVFFSFFFFLYFKIMHSPIHHFFSHKGCFWRHSFETEKFYWAWSVVGLHLWPDPLTAALFCWRIHLCQWPVPYPFFSLRFWNGLLQWEW